MTTMNMCLLIIGCMVVTWLPRVMPFLFVRLVTLPGVALRWLKYIPICILSALVFDAILKREGHLVVIEWLHAAALLPTIVVAIWTKSLSLTVIVGVITMGALRLFFT